MSLFSILYKSSPYCCIPDSETSFQFLKQSLGLLCLKILRTLGRSWRCKIFTKPWENKRFFIFFLAYNFSKILARRHIIKCNINVTLEMKPEHLRWSPFHSSFLNYLFMCILPACTSVCHMCAWCPRRPKEFIGSPGTIITDDWVSCHVDAENLILYNTGL